MKSENQASSTSVKSEKASNLQASSFSYAQKEPKKKPLMALQSGVLPEKASFQNALKPEHACKTFWHARQFSKFV